ncbi:unnamed protein product, partial [Iphiclides podalirius]
MTTDGKSVPKDVLEADAVLKQLGQAGRFHIRMYVMVAMATFQVGLLHTTYIFLAADVPYRETLTTENHLSLEKTN